MMFTITFGLFMGYEVFLLSHVQEEWCRSGDPGAAWPTRSPPPAGSSPRRPPCGGEAAAIPRAGCVACCCLSGCGARE
jgi:hypothetical protein